MLGAPAASCAKVESTRVSHHGYTGSPGIPARNGFNGFLRALPGDRAFLSPSPTRIAPRNLTPASGRQDHTTSPSAGLRIRQSAACVHRIPPRVRDDRDTPLGWGGMAGNVDLIWGKREGIYFCEGGWTGGIRLKPKENFFSARMRRAIVALNASIKNATLVRKRGNFRPGLGRGVREISISFVEERTWRATF